LCIKCVGYPIFGSKARQTHLLTLAVNLLLLLGILSAMSAETIERRTTSDLNIL